MYSRFYRRVVVANSGCYGYDISKALVSINVIDINECRKRDKKEKIRFLYRKAELPGEFIITSVTLRGVSKTSEEIEKNKMSL